jgi:prevent-host-death family protein
VRRVGVRELQRRVSEILRSLEEEGPVVVTVHGRARAALIPLDEDRVEDLALAWASGRLPPPGLTPRLRSVLRRFKAGLRRLYGDRLAGVYLYGSYARGDAREGSDVDVLVVLRGPVDPHEEIERMGEVRTRILVDTGVLISALPVSEEDYREGRGPWLLTARREGVPL